MRAAHGLTERSTGLQQTRHSLTPGEVAAPTDPYRNQSVVPLARSAAGPARRIVLLFFRSCYPSGRARVRAPREECGLLPAYRCFLADQPARGSLGPSRDVFIVVLAASLVARRPPPWRPHCARVRRRSRPISSQHDWDSPVTVAPTRPGSRPLRLHMGNSVRQRLVPWSASLLQLLRSQDRGPSGGVGC